MSRSSRFSPRSLEPAQLERLTVAREPLLRWLEDAVTGAVVSGQARFDLVLGPRGAGKSHLIGVLEGRLRQSAPLTGRAIVIAPPEELHPLSLVQFLAQLLRELPDDVEFGPVADALRSLQRQRDGNQEQRAVDLIRVRLRERSLIILLENLDELFEALGRDGQQRLRNILQTERSWSIVATSRSLIPAFTKYEAPFHGTFNQHRLEPLTAEECRDMLAALAAAHGKEPLAVLLRSNKGLARVRGLHHLLGGNPRAMAFLFRQLDEHRLDHFELALGDLADELKPYFQEQMTRVSPAQRAILELLAESWRPLTVTEIAERSFTSQASTSSALRHLRRDALVQTLEVGRERYYELGDPLHRLARANERPRDAIAAFARVIRWWYADDSDQEFFVRQTYALSESSVLGSVAHDGSDSARMAVATVQEAKELLANSPEYAIVQARARLQRRQSPGMQAALVLARERSGDEAGAVDELLSTVGPLDTNTKTSLMILSLESPSAAQSESFELLDAPLTSEIARTLQAVRRATIMADDSGARLELIATFEGASPNIVRLASDLVARSLLFMRWTDVRAHGQLGVLLGNLRPSRSAPTLEWGLTHALRHAWHYRRLPQLIAPIASLEPLIAVLPESSRRLLAMARFCTSTKVPDQDALAEVFEIWARIARQAPDPELTKHDPPLLGLGIVTEMLTMLPDLPNEVWTSMPDLDSESRHGFAVVLYLGMYHWLASRRPIEPLQRLAVLLREHFGLAWFPERVLTSARARDAVAQLSEPERAVIRSILEQYGDREGLAELALDAKR